MKIAARIVSECIICTMIAFALLVYLDLLKTLMGGT